MSLAYATEPKLPATVNRYMSELLSQSLARHGAGTEAELAAITRRLSGVAQRTFRPGEELVRAETQPRECLFVLQGVACQHKALADGRRQIVGFSIPGDLCDAQGMWLRMDYSITAVTRIRAMAIPHSILRPLIIDFPALGEALWRWTLADAAIAREWLVGLGRRTAVVRIAHFMCELQARHEAAGITAGPRLAFPLTQTHLADALGLSVVHVNRSLQQLRALKLISLHNQSLTIHDWDALADFAEFNPDYLSLDGRPAGQRASEPSPQFA